MKSKITMAIDTATESCSVVLRVDGTVYEKIESERRRHAQVLLPQIDAVLQEAGVDKHGIDEIVFGHGPGSFTGLRIGASVVQALAYTLDIKVMMVSTLQVLAWQAFRKFEASNVLVIQNAHMGEVYWGAFRVGEGCVEVVVPDQLSTPEAVINPFEKSACVIGDGVCNYEPLQEFVERDALTELNVKNSLASDLLSVAEVVRPELVPAEKVIPVYLRGREAWRLGGS